MNIAPVFCIALAILWFVFGVFRMLTTKTDICTYTDASLIFIFSILFLTLPPMFLVGLSIAFSLM